MTAHRLAVYAVPPAGGPLERLAGAWLGRLPDGRPPGDPPPAGLAPGEREKIVAGPRRYGFHGTLRAPMRLRLDRDEAAFHAAVAALAERTPPVAATLSLGALDGFLALLPHGPAEDLAALHGAAMRATEPLRAPLSADERARRMEAGLTAEQVARLDRWGYPHVMDGFRFHMTLTGRLDPATRARVAGVLDLFLAPVLDRPVPLADLAVFAEPVPGADLIEIARRPLRGTAA